MCQINVRNVKAPKLKVKGWELKMANFDKVVRICRVSLSNMSNFSDMQGFSFYLKTRRRLRQLLNKLGLGIFPKTLFSKL